MGQLGFQEIMVIFLIALLVLGPKKLPELGKSLGKGLREFKRATDDLKQSWDQQMRDADVSSDIKDTVKDINKDLHDTEREVESAISAANPSGTTEPAEQTVSKEQV